MCEAFLFYSFAAFMHKQSIVVHYWISAPADVELQVTAGSHHVTTQRDHSDSKNKKIKKFWNEKGC